MGETLKPCPFCQHTDLTIHDNSVTCNTCDSSGPDLGHCTGPACRAAAIEAWNRRSSPAAEPVALRISYERALAEAVRLLEKFADPDGHSDGLDEDTAVAFWPATAGDIRDVRVFLSRSRKDTDNAD